jgi:glycosyltransferase involved in cell wall biosynthesis
MKIDKLYYIYIYIFFLLSFSKCFLFSVIISIYNTGRYLDDAIGSLINQTIDFKNIQVILVNDGSEDQTEEICLKYQKKYKNILKLIIVE